MPRPPTQPWFVGRRHGYGITPANWQGWAAIAAFEAILLLDLTLLAGGVRLLGAAVLGLAFFGLASRKTNEEWRWHWSRH